MPTQGPGMQGSPLLPEVIHESLARMAHPQDSVHLRCYIFSRKLLRKFKLLRVFIGEQVVYHRDINVTGSGMFPGLGGAPLAL